MNKRCGRTSSLRIHWICWLCLWNTDPIPPNWLLLQCKSCAYCAHTHLSYRSLSSRYQTEPCQYWLACLATSHTPYLGVWHTIFTDIWRVLVYDHLKQVCIDSSGSYHELRPKIFFLTTKVKSVLTLVQKFASLCKKVTLQWVIQTKFYLKWCQFWK